MVHPSDDFIEGKDTETKQECQLEGEEYLQREPSVPHDFVYFVQGFRGEAEKLAVVLQYYAYEFIYEGAELSIERYELFEGLGPK